MKNDRKQRPDTRRQVPEKFLNERTVAPLQAQSRNQKLYLQALAQAPHVISTGPAGVGKTFVAAYHAACEFRRGKKIIITRPLVSCGKSLGFFPGTLEEKMAPWMAPLLNDLKHFLGAGTMECALKAGTIAMVPFETLRGSSFGNTVVIVEEAQNMDIASARLIVTRTADDCQLILDGDLQQNDLRGEPSGLVYLINLVKARGMPVPLIEFTIADCVRSGICREWLEAFAA